MSIRSDAFIARINALTHEHPEDSAARRMAAGRAILKFIGDDEVWRIYQEARDWASLEHDLDNV